MYCTPTQTHKARKPYVCDNCAGAIEVGSDYKRWMSVDGGCACSSRMHPECLKSLLDDAGGDFEYIQYSGECPL
jgi:hypothetical protein